jgi:hypothetical protein
LYNQQPRFNTDFGIFVHMETEDDDPSLFWRELQPHEQYQYELDSLRLLANRIARTAYLPDDDSLRTQRRLFREYRRRRVSLKRRWIGDPAAPVGEIDKIDEIIISSPARLRIEDTTVEDRIVISILSATLVAFGAVAMASREAIPGALAVVFGLVGLAVALAWRGRGRS